MDNEELKGASQIDLHDAICALEQRVSTLEEGARRASSAQDQDNHGSSCPTLDIVQPSPNPAWMTPVSLSELAVGEIGVSKNGIQIWVRDGQGRDGNIPTIMRFNDNSTEHRAIASDHLVYRVQQPAQPATPPLNGVYQGVFWYALNDLGERITALEQGLGEVNVWAEKAAQNGLAQASKIAGLEASNRGICKSGELDQRNIHALNDIVNQHKEQLDELRKANERRFHDHEELGRRVETLEQQMSAHLGPGPGILEIASRHNEAVRILRDLVDAIKGGEVFQPAYAAALSYLAKEEAADAAERG